MFEVLLGKGGGKGGVRANGEEKPLRYHVIHLSDVLNHTSRFIPRHVIYVCSKMATL